MVCESCLLCKTYIPSPQVYSCPRGNRFFGCVAISPVKALSRRIGPSAKPKAPRNPIKFGHTSPESPHLRQPFLCGDFSTVSVSIPESRDPTLWLYRASPGLRPPIRARRAVRAISATGPFSAFVAAVPTMRKSVVTPPSPRARGGGKGMCAVGAIVLATCVPVVGT